MTFPSTPGRNWSTGGRGGTLNAAGTGPGPYYALKTSPAVQMVGANGGWTSDDVNVRAVRGGVLSIQRALNRRVKPKIQITGRYDIATSNTVRTFQQNSKLRKDGVFDMNTARCLFTYDIQDAGLDIGFADWKVAWGIINTESQFDPGSVGYVDPTDLGIAQINGPSHPNMTERERLRVEDAIDFVFDYLENALAHFHDMRDAIASYNLGIGGATNWINEKRPDVWRNRNVKQYIDGIQGAYDTWKADFDAR